MSVSNEQCQTGEEKNPCLQWILWRDRLIVRSTDSEKIEDF